MTLTRMHLETLLSNFAHFTEPDGTPNPWFTYDEVVRQFAGEFPDRQPRIWLAELVSEGKAKHARREGKEVWAWCG